MTRVQIRTKLRRRLNEEVGDSAGGWSDTELNGEINEAYAWVQKEIYKVSPEAHLFWDTMNVVSGTNWYPLPATFAIHRVGLLNADTGLYKKIFPKRYDDILELTTLTDTYYARRGQWIGLFPTPTTSTTDGLEILHSPIMSMAADSEVPRIKLPSHEAIVLKAKDMILGDLDVESPATRQKLADIVNDFPLWYDNSQDMPDRLQVDL